MFFLTKLRKHWRFIIVAIVVTIGIILNSYAVILYTKQQTNVCQTPVQTNPSLLSANPNLDIPSIANPIALIPTFKPAPSDQPLYGHFPYPEADANSLMTIASYAKGEYQRFERMAPEAAIELMKMFYAARYEGVWIVPVSAFRNVATQEILFRNQIQRRGSPEAAAKLSAPPGYSEHQTGYAIDLTDGHFPKQDITYDFDKTDAFRWLNLHAKEFGFEMSFPENNSQGVSYEPWHWRFIISPTAEKVFARARKKI